MSNTNEYCDLLIVEADDAFHVVEAPTNEAFVGNFVSFTNGGIPMMGKVVDKMWCEKGDDRYRCIGYIETIHQAEKIFRPLWERKTN